MQTIQWSLFCSDLHMVGNYNCMKTLYRYMFKITTRSLGLFSSLLIKGGPVVGLYSSEYLNTLPPDVIFYSHNASNSISAGALSRTLLGELAPFPETFSWIIQVLILKEGKGGK